MTGSGYAVATAPPPAEVTFTSGGEWASTERNLTLQDWRLGGKKIQKPKSISDAKHRHCHGGRINVFCVRIDGKFSSILGSSEED